MDKLTVAQALDAICTAYDYLWWHESGSNSTPGTVLFRGRAWFIESRYEPPLSTTRSVEAALHFGANRAVSTPLVDSMVGLTIEQLQGIAGRLLVSPYSSLPSFSRQTMYSFMAGSGWKSACAAFYWLRFWSHLSAEQKQEMLSSDGLPGNQLAPAQQNELLQSLFTSSSLQIVPTEVTSQWKAMRLHVSYEENHVSYYLPDYAPQWKPNELRSAILSFSIKGAEIAYGSSLPLPVALAPPPQPKKPNL